VEQIAEARRAKTMASLITISRQYGSQGELVAEEIAWLLKANYLDKEIISLAANRAGVAESLVAERDERQGSSRVERAIRLVAETLARSAALEVSPYDIVQRFDQGLSTTELIDKKGYLKLPASQTLDDKRYLELVTGVMNSLAQSGNAVVMGRGGNMILRDAPNVLRVFIVAPLEVRVRRVMEEEGVDAQVAARGVNRVDASRADFLKRMFKANWEDPANYDLVVNTGKCSVEYVARLIANTAWDWERQ
jgi:cytidylate kinase